MSYKLISNILLLKCLFNHINCDFLKYAKEVLYFTKLDYVAINNFLLIIHWKTLLLYLAWQWCMYPVPYIKLVNISIYSKKIIKSKYNLMSGFLHDLKLMLYAKISHNTIKHTNISGNINYLPSQPMKSQGTRNNMDSHLRDLT